MTVSGNRSPIAMEENKRNYLGKNRSVYFFIRDAFLNLKGDVNID
jgi:hypothetical protein